MSDTGPVGAKPEPVMSVEQYEIRWRKATALQCIPLHRSEWLRFAKSYADYIAAQSPSSPTQVQEQFPLSQAQMKIIAEDKNTDLMQKLAWAVTEAMEAAGSPVQPVGSKEKK